jgi:hypothetical protein
MKITRHNAVPFRIGSILFMASMSPFVLTWGE